MTRLCKRRFTTLCVLALLSIGQSGHTAPSGWPPGPHNYGVEFRDVDPTLEEIGLAGDGEELPRIVVDKQTPPGKIMSATCTAEKPAGDTSAVSYRWSADAGVDFGRFPTNESTVTFAATIGQHVLTCRVRTWDGKEPGGDDFTESFTVGDPPPPEPDKPLIQLVTPEQAPLLAGAYHALAQLADSFTSAEHFWANHDALLKAKGLLGHGATEAVKARLTPFEKATLGATLAAISKEFGEPPAPPVPPVVEGKRRVVILRESGDDLPADARLYVQLRNDATAAYLKSKGHTLEIQDADNSPLMVDGLQLPQLFILDASTGAVVNQQPRPATSAAILEAVKQHGG